MTSFIAYLNSFSNYTDVYTHRYNQIYYIILDCVSLIGRLFGLLHTAQGLKKVAKVYLEPKMGGL